jgi:hypothetical protein
MTRTINNPLPKPTPTAYGANDTAGIEQFVNRLIQSRCPDTKSQKKAFAVLNNALQCATNLMMYGARDVLWDISGGFEELSDIASEKATDAPTYDSTIKWDNRAKFYEMLANWASASLEMTEKTLGNQQSPTTNIDAHSSGPQFDYPKDAEDDSDPYIKTTPLYGPRPPAPRPLNDTWQKIASALKMRHTNAEISRARDVFDRVVEPVWKDPGGDICLVLEKFGDECANIDASAPTHDRFWEGCVMIADDLRADIAANTISAKVNYTTSSPAPDPTPRNEVCHSAEPEDAGQMWEVCGDPHRALFYTSLHAEHWAREMFPTENADKRYARIQYRNILKFPA